MFHTIIAGCDGFDRGGRPPRSRRSCPRRPVPPSCSSPPSRSRRCPSRSRSASKRRRSNVRSEPCGTSWLRMPRRRPSRRSRPAMRCATPRAASTPTSSSSALGVTVAVDRLVGADHALQVLHSAPESVAVVPDGTTVRPELGRVAVGLDESPEARAAVDLAADLARATGARLWLHVVIDDRPTATYVQPFDWPAASGEEDDRWPRPARPHARRPPRRRRRRWGDDGQRPSRCSRTPPRRLICSSSARGDGAR